MSLGFPASELLSKLRKTSDKLNAWLQNVESSQETKGLRLESFLIMPVQRYPRYRLLLQDLLKHTPESHPDHADLSSALETVAAVLLTLNECGDKANAVMRVVEISDQLPKPKDKTGEPEFKLVQPHRYLVKESTTLTTHVKSPVATFCFNDCVIIAKFPKGLAKLKGQTRFRKFLRVPFSSDTTCRGSDKNPRLLTLGSGTSTASLLVALLASDAAERDAWIQSINTAKKDWLEQGRLALNAEPPAEMRPRRRSMFRS